MRSRPATAADAAAIARIYSAGIAARTATFETELRTESDILRWFDSRYPVVVVEDEGGVIGFAAASAYSSRDCYAGIAEFSVYVDGARRKRGAGRMAMTALLEACEQAGFWKLMSRVFLENTASRALLRSLGFREAGIHEKHARLDGVWRDVVIVERLIPANLR